MGFCLDEEIENNEKQRPREFYCLRALFFCVIIIVLFPHGRISCTPWGCIP